MLSFNTNVGVKNPGINTESNFQKEFDAVYPALMDKVKDMLKASDSAFLEEMGEKYIHDPIIQSFAAQRPANKAIASWIPEPLVLSGHPEFGSSFLPLDDNVRIITPRNSLERGRLGAHIARSFDSNNLSSNNIDFTARLFNMWGLFAPWLTEPDFVMGVSQSVGRFRPAHTDAEETNVFSVAPEVDMVSVDVIDVCRKVLKTATSFAAAQRSRLQKTIKTSVPLFTLPGFPYAGRGGSLVSAAFTIAQIKIGRFADSRGMRIPEVADIYRNAFGPNSFNEIYRIQTTNKVIPDYIKGRFLWTHNLAARARAVFPGSKTFLSMNRQRIKEVTEGLFSLPHIPRDPNYIASVIQSFQKLDGKGGMKIIALDASKADKTQGKGRARTISGILAQATNDHPDVYFEEMNFPFVQVRGNQLLEGVAAGQLPSGVSHTTASNMVNFGLLFFVHLAITRLRMSKTEVEKQITSKLKYQSEDGSVKGDPSGLILSGPGGKFGMVNFGDDILCVTDLEEEEIFAAGEEISIILSREPIDRFLGRDYGPGLTSGKFRTGYNLGRQVSKLLFPERDKAYPYTGIAYLARLEAMDQSVRNDFHESMKHAFVPFVGIEWQTQDKLMELYRTEWLDKALKDSKKSNLLFNALSAITHGDEQRLEGIYDSPMMDERLVGMLGQFSVDIDNIDIEELKKVHGFDPQVGVILSSITDDPTTWNAGITQLATFHNLHWLPGEPVF